MPCEKNLTKAIIYLDNFRKNMEAVRKITGAHRKICVPVKADAYGHGAVSVSHCALEAGAASLGVSRLSEGAELRAAGITAPILLFSQVLPEELPGIISLQITPFVSDADFIKETEQAARQAKKKQPLHLKIDTGMGRLGCRVENAAELAVQIAKSQWLFLEGTATHLSVADSAQPDDIAYTKEQLCRFRGAIASIKEAGVEPGIVHAANSGALVFHEDSHFDMVRPGIFLYGYSPSAEPEHSAKPVMEFRSTVSVIKKIKKGEAVSYGRTWTAPEDTFIGVISAGYADGIPRRLSNNHSVLIRGKTYPLVGRVCMDQCMVNLGSKCEIERWEKAVIFGPDFTDAAGLAEKLQTIPYEVLCGIGKRVVREHLVY